jgi:hypothetical protein
MVGKMTVVKPLSNVLIPVTKVTDAITMAVVPFEVSVTVLSSPRNDTSSLRESLTIVEGRRVLATLLALANTACGACGIAMSDNSIDVRVMALDDTYFAVLWTKQHDDSTETCVDIEDAAEATRQDMINKVTA